MDGRTSGKRVSIHRAVIVAAFALLVIAAAGCGAFKKSSAPDVPSAQELTSSTDFPDGLLKDYDEPFPLPVEQGRQAAAVVNSNIVGGITCAAAARTFQNTATATVSSDFAWITPTYTGWPSQYVVYKFTLSGCSEAIEDFYFTDYMDPDLLIQGGSISVKINGVNAAYSMETTALGEYYPGMIGRRFILDDPLQPPAGSPHTVIPAGSTLVIQFTLNVDPTKLVYPLSPTVDYKKYYFPNFHWSGLTPSNKIVWGYDDTHADTPEFPEKNCDEIMDVGNTLEVRICADNIPPEIYAIEDAPGACNGHTPGDFGIIGDGAVPGQLATIPNLPNCRLVVKDNGSIRDVTVYSAPERPAVPFYKNEGLILYPNIVTGQASGDTCIPYTLTAADSANIRYYIAARDRSGINSYWTGINYPGTSVTPPATYAQMPYFVPAEAPGVDNYWSVTYFRSTRCGPSTYDGSLLTGWASSNKNRGVFGGTTDWIYVHHFAAPKLITSARVSFAEYADFLDPDYLVFQTSNDGSTWVTPAYTTALVTSGIYKMHWFYLTPPQTVNYARVLMGDAVAPFSLQVFMGDLRFF